jgi:hypothetical protein
MLEKKLKSIELIEKFIIIYLNNAIKYTMLIA